LTAPKVPTTGNPNAEVAVYTGAATVLALAAFVLVMLRRERARTQHLAPSTRHL